MITLQPRFIQYVSHVDLAYASNITSLFGIVSITLVLVTSTVIDKLSLRYSSAIVRKCSLVTLALLGSLAGIVLVSYPCQVLKVPANKVPNTTLRYHCQLQHAVFSLVLLDWPSCVPSNQCHLKLAAISSARFMHTQTWWQIFQVLWCRHCLAPYWTWAQFTRLKRGTQCLSSLFFSLFVAPLFFTVAHLACLRGPQGHLPTERASHRLVRHPSRQNKNHKIAPDFYLYIKSRFTRHLECPTFLGVVSQIEQTSHLSCARL